MAIRFLDTPETITTLPKSNIRFLEDKPSLTKKPKNWVVEGLKKTGEDIFAGVKDFPAQLQDLLTMPSRLTNLPHPPMVSKLATQTIPKLAEKTTTPIGEFNVPTISYGGLKSFVKGKGLKLDIQPIAPTPLDIAVMGFMGKSAIQNKIAITKWNNLMNKGIETERTYLTIYDNLPSLEKVMEKGGIKLSGDLTSEQKVNIILDQAKRSPTLGGLIVDLQKKKIAPKIPFENIIDETPQYEAWKKSKEPTIRPELNVDLHPAPKIVTEDLPITKLPLPKLKFLPQLETVPLQKGVTVQGQGFEVTGGKKKKGLIAKNLAKELRTTPGQKVSLMKQGVIQLEPTPKWEQGIVEITPEKLKQVYQEVGIDVEKIIKSKIGGWYVYHPYAMEETIYRYERKLIKEEEGKKVYERTKIPIKLKRDFVSNEEDAIELIRMHIAEAKMRGAKIDVKNIDDIIDKNLKQEKEAPPELQPLAEEAKKYKSAEEFVESQDIYDKVMINVGKKRGMESVFPKDKRMIIQTVSNAMLGKDLKMIEDVKNEFEKQESQLTDIWNKANATPTEGKVGEWNIEKPKTEFYGQVSKEEQLVNYKETLKKEQEKLTTLRSSNSQFKQRQQIANTKQRIVQLEQEIKLSTPTEGFDKIRPFKLSEKGSILNPAEPLFQGAKLVAKGVKVIDKNFLQSEINLLSLEGKKVWREHQYGAKAMQRYNRDKLDNKIAHINKIPENSKMLEKAMYGDKKAYETLPQEIKNFNDGYRNTQMSIANDIANHIDRFSSSTEIDEKARETQPELFEDYINQIVSGEAGKLIPPKELARIIRNNKDYLYRFYDKEYQPTQEEIQTAIQDLMAKGITQQQSEIIVDKAMSNESFDIPFEGKMVKVSKGSFKGRYNIPPSLRKVMGEVTDPDIVLPVTMTRLETIKAKYDLFANLSKTPDVRDIKPVILVRGKEAWKRIPDDKLAWGDLAGKYVSPDLFEMLNQFNTLKNKNLELLTSISRLIKMGKTTYSIGNWIQQFTGNIEPSIYAENSILNPLNLKYYQKALNVIFGKDRELAELLIKKGGFDTTFIHSGDYDYMVDYIKNPTHLPMLIKLASHFNKRFINAWASIDQLFKVSSIIKYMEVEKMSVENAIEKMSKWYPMFSEPSRAMRRLQTDTTLRVIREIGLSPFVSFRMARNVILRNILKDPKKRLFWGAARASRWVISTLLLTYLSTKGKKYWEEFKKRHPTKTATGDILPTVIDGKLVPTEDRWDIFKLTDVFSPYDYVGENILLGAVVDLAKERQIGKVKPETSFRLFGQRITPSILSVPLERQRLEAKKEGATPYMRKKISLIQIEKDISGYTGVKPYLSEMLTIRRKLD